MAALLPEIAGSIPAGMSFFTLSDWKDSSDSSLITPESKSVMRTTDLSELAAFDAVARHKSFRRASEERGVTASALSHAVSNLEARVGIRLLNRTTRSVSLTDAGAMLLDQLSPAFQ
jgi:hypothetical protein